jgi:hypothetical protein
VKANVQAIEALLDLPQIHQNPVLDFARGQIESMEYYNNRVRQNADLPKGKEWAALLTRLAKEVFQVLENHFPKKFAFVGVQSFADKITQSVSTMVSNASSTNVAQPAQVAPQVVPAAKQPV